MSSQISVNSTLLSKQTDHPVEVLSEPLPAPAPELGRHRPPVLLEEVLAPRLELVPIEI